MTNPDAAAAPPFPFLFLGHGSRREDKAQECDVCFAADVPERARAAIEAELPVPLSAFAHWDRDWLHFGSDDGFAFDLAQTYGTSDPWRRFEEDFDARLARIHDAHAISFVVQPGGYVPGDDDGWNAWSVSRVAQDVLPRLQSYFRRVPPRETETARIGYPSWTFSTLLSLQDDARPVSALAPDLRSVWLETLNLTMGYSPYIDRINAERWLACACDGALDERAAAEVVLSYYAASRQAAGKLLERPGAARYIARLLAECRRGRGWWQQEQLGRIAEHTVGSDALLSAELLAGLLDERSSRPQDWVAAGNAFGLAGRWERVREISLRALKMWPHDQAIRSNVLWAATQTGDAPAIAEQLDWADRNEVTHPTLLQNLLYAANEAGDFERACAIADRYEQPPLFGSGGHYVNMINAYLGCANPRRGEGVVREVERRLRTEPLFAPRFPVLFHSLASYYAKTRERDGVLLNIRAAKKFGYAQYASIAADPDFAPLRSDPEFCALF